MEKPTKDELKKYYAEKYYQADIEGSYRASYSNEEFNNINARIKQKHKAFSHLLKKDVGNLLDIGCGEGWTLAYFDKLNWEVAGIDFSTFGCNTHNPKLVEKIIQGDIEEQLEGLIAKSTTYDVIWLDNVLEHLIDPSAMLEGCKQLSHESTVLIVEVPNDFSVVHLFG